MNNNGALKITAGALDAMARHFQKELPREGCGFLAGRNGVAHRFYPINNLNPDCRKFLMDPLHVMRTETSILRRNQRILGICHSHPDGECSPSNWDISGAFFDTDQKLPLWSDEVQVIALMVPPENPTVRGFRIHKGGQVDQVELDLEGAL